jgi:hypothetical protein
MKTTLPSGKYWIGDPCYFISNENWSDVCAQCFKPDQNDRDGIWIEADGKRFILIGTAYGDGGYELAYDGRVITVLGVDAGCLSIIPVSCEEGRMNGGYVVDIPESFEVEASGGNFTFGKYSVNTDGEDSDEEYDWWEEEDEEYDWWEEEDEEI